MAKTISTETVMAGTPELFGKPYYASLDSLRCYSAFAVIVTHIELIKALHNLPCCYGNFIIANLGPVGVYFFFTLSGFLITRLLLFERATSGRISVGWFYVRRSLRIWPLYFLCVVLGFFVLPSCYLFNVPSQSNHLHDHFSDKLLLYALILPQIAGAMYAKVPNIGQLWSIGVEELFYLFWPLTVIGFGTRTRAYVVALAMLVSCKAAFVLALHVTQSSSETMLVWKEIIAASKFECMIIGALFALPDTSRYYKLLSRTSVQLLSIVLVPTSFALYLTKFDDPAFLLFSVLFSVIIWNCADNPKSLLKSNRLCNYFGRISYGIYCYHFMVIAVTINLMPPAWLRNPWVANGLIYVMVVAITLVISSLSHTWFELPFTRLKHRLRHPRIAGVVCDNATDIETYCAVGKKD